MRKMDSNESIWRGGTTVTELNIRAEETIIERLGIRITQVGPDFLRGTMPVDHRTVQPRGILHGGASVVLAETLGSIASTLCIDNRKSVCVGLEVNANHLRTVGRGIVTGTARPVHIGSRTHVWTIEVRDDEDRLSAICRLTVVVLKRS